MTPIKSIFFTLLFVAFSLSTNAQDAELPKQVLLSSDIDHLITSFNPLKTDLEKLGDKYENIQDPNAMQALAANEEVKAVFEKHGWSENYYQKFYAMTQGYTFIKMEESMKEVPAEQRPYMEQMIKQYQLANANAVHPDDLALIKKHFTKLDTFFEEQQ